MRNYTAIYTPIPSGYLGQLLDWPEVVTEGKTVEECQDMLSDALQEMVLAYKQLQKPIPLARLARAEGYPLQASLKSRTRDTI